MKNLQGKIMSKVLQIPPDLIKDFLLAEKESLLRGEKKLFGNFMVSHTKDIFEVKPFNKSVVLQFVEDNLNSLTNLPFLKNVLVALRDSFQSKDVNELINLCYFDLIVFNMLPVEKQNFWLSKLPTLKMLQKKFNRAKLFEINKTAICFDGKTRNKSYQEILGVGFDFVEMPAGFSFRKLKKLSQETQSILLEKGIADFKCSLRIKKLGLYKTKGFYSPELNTIFLDPRHLNVLRHELGHYVYKILNIQDGNEEAYADSF